MRIAFVTSNTHKVAEVREVLAEYGIEVYQAKAPKVEIQSTDLREVAVSAAIIAYSVLKTPLIVEDAGLFIRALNGFPGPYSSYVYSTIGISGVLKLLEGVKDRYAEFVSVIAYADEDGVRVFEGRVKGTITHEPRGNRGFGFDPIFMPIGLDKTFAEMSIHEKNRYSHRGMAARKLGEWLSKEKLYK